MGVFVYGFALQPIPLVEPDPTFLKSPQSFVRLGLIILFPCVHLSLLLFQSLNPQGRVRRPA
jgi:hypothetical protein